MSQEQMASRCQDNAINVQTCVSDREGEELALQKVEVEAGREWEFAPMQTTPLDLRPMARGWCIGRGLLLGDRAFRAAWRQRIRSRSVHVRPPPYERLAMDCRCALNTDREQGPG